MNRPTKFVDVLLRGAGPTPELLTAFALGLLMAAILGNLVYDLLVTPGAVWGVLWRPLLASALLTGLAYALYECDRRRERNVEVDIDESRLAPPHAGLIWLLGPGPVDHLLFALGHHRKGGGAAHCWLVMKSHMKSVQDAFQRVSDWVSEGGMEIQLHPLYIHELDAQQAYQAVQGIFSQGAAEAGLEPGQVIADITGGTKQLTAGMVLAALTTGGALEYVESDRDAEGQPIPGTLRVIQVDTTFYVTQETEDRRPATSD
jgi:hypothetical protein